MQRSGISRRSALSAIAGACAAPWVPVVAQTNDILIGQTTALTGAIGGLGNDALRSPRALFDQVNRAGGIHGRKLRLIVLDDGYDAARAVENGKRLIAEEKVFALLGVLGTPANMALLPLISESGTPSIGPFTGAEALRVPFNRLIFNTRASYGDEVERIVGHLDVRGLERVSVVYQENAFGKDGLEAVVRSMGRRQRKPLGIASLKSDGSDVDAAVSKIAQAKPQGVILITAGASSPAFVKAYLQRGAGVQFFALSVMGTAAAVNALGPAGEGIVVAQVAPYPHSMHMPLVSEYQKVLSGAGEKQFTHTSMESFISAKVLLEGLKRAGANLTRDRFIAALDSLGTVDLGGFPLRLSASDHRGSKYVELTMISKGGRLVR